ncbi:hypothetical protein MMC16_005682 [Acarospora aff. strigata]|nr:hypothetical protein [Acarospora aff. strigata]
MQTQKKIGISVLFATGLFACISSVMRLVESIRRIESPDVTFDLLPVSLWATAEVSSGLIVCCLPIMPRFFARAQSRPIHAASFPTVNRASFPRPRAQYLEMDDMSSKGFVTRSMEVKSRQSRAHQREGGHDEHKYLDARNGMQMPAIRKTISINQSSAPFESSAESVPWPTN